MKAKDKKYISSLKRFESGGTTTLTTGQELAYKKWMDSIGHTKTNGYNVDDNYNGIDYDYRGYWKKYGHTGLSQSGKNDVHFTDEFKLPNHPTHSDESMYRKIPNNAKGYWEGDNFKEFEGGGNVTYIGRTNVNGSKLVPSNKYGSIVDITNKSTSTPTPINKPYVFNFGTGSYITSDQAKAQGFADQLGVPLTNQMTLSDRGYYVGSNGKIWKNQAEYDSNPNGFIHDPEAMGLQRYENGGMIPPKGLKKYFFGTDGTTEPPKSGQAEIVLGNNNQVDPWATPDGIRRKDVFNEPDPIFLDQNTEPIINNVNNTKTNSVKFGNPLPHLINFIDYYTSVNDQNRRDQAFKQNMLKTLNPDPVENRSEMFGNNNQIIKAEKGAIITKGTSRSIANIEAEGGEYKLTPDGEGHMYSGPKHKDGGIPDYAEEGTIIFSDKIKIPKDILGMKTKGKTFAEVAKKLDTTELLKTINNPTIGISDPIALETAKSNFQKKSGKREILIGLQQYMNGNSNGSYAEKGTIKSGIPNKYGVYSKETVDAILAGKIKAPKDFDWVGSRIDQTQSAGENTVGAYGKLKDSDVAEFKERHKTLVNKIEQVTGKPFDVKDPAQVGMFQKEYNKTYKAKTGHDYFKGDATNKDDSTLDDFDNMFGRYTWAAPTFGDEMPAGITKKEPTAPVITDTKFPTPNIQTKDNDVIREGLGFGNVAGPLASFIGSYNKYRYWTPDYHRQIIDPVKMNIQDQLNDVSSELKAAYKYNTGNPSVKNARNSGMFISALKAKNEAFARKQNFDAQSEFQAQNVNAEYAMKEQMLDNQSADRVYNEYMAGADANATEYRIRAIDNLGSKVAAKDSEIRSANWYSKLFNNYSNKGLDFEAPTGDIFSAPTSVNEENPLIPKTKIPKGALGAVIKRKKI